MNEGPTIRTGNFEDLIETQRRLDESRIKIRETEFEALRKQHEDQQKLKHDKHKARLDLIPKSAFGCINKSKLFYDYFEKLQTRKCVETIGLLLLEYSNLIEVGEVLAYGAELYGEQSWKKVKDVTRYWNALGRHIWHVDQDPESKDEESGLKHAAHALTNVLFILEFERTKTEEEMASYGVAAGANPADFRYTSTDELDKAIKELTEAREALNKKSICSCST